MDRSPKQKINKETQTLNDTLDEIVLIDVSRIFHSKTAEYTFFSSAHRIFSKIDYILVTNKALVNLRKLKLYQAFFSDHSAYKIKVMGKKICRKHKHMETKQCVSK